MPLSETADLESHHARLETTPSSSVRRTEKMKKKKGAKKPLKNGSVEEVVVAPVELEENATKELRTGEPLLDLIDVDLSAPDQKTGQPEDTTGIHQQPLETTGFDVLPQSAPSNGPVQTLSNVSAQDSIEWQDPGDDTPLPPFEIRRKAHVRDSIAQKPLERTSGQSISPVISGLPEASTAPVPQSEEAVSLLAQPTSPRQEAVVRQKRLSQAPTSLDNPAQNQSRPHYLSDFGSQGFHPVADIVESKRRASSEKGCCRFDSFANSGDTISAVKAKDALLVGCDGGLDVYRVLPTKMEVVGRLEGLNGAVVDAKILPEVLHADLKQHLPLVAVVLHTTSPIHTATNGEAQRETQQPSGPSIKFQASVQVYSLRTQKHLSTLFTSLPASVPQASDEHMAYPEILGTLRVYADGSHIVVASSVSGEVYVFRHSAGDNEDHMFQCIGKFWTTLQESRALSTSKAASTGDTNHSQDDLLRPLPLLALGNRWLVICCPSSSSKLSIQGTPLLYEGQQPLGVGSHNPPMQPVINTEVETVDAEGVVSRMTRQAAQELLKASRKGIELGLAGWREFTNPSPPQRHVNPVRTEADTQAFPPTHAPLDHAQRLEQEPAVLSIIDLEHLARSALSNVKPLSAFTSTFAIEDGCNFISFSPDGLRLLTTNRTGETSSIWDLRRAFFSSCSSIVEQHADTAMLGPSVQCIHRLQRSSPCVVVEAVWSQSQSELALQTTNGTTHLHYLSTKESRSRRTRHSSHGPRDWSGNKSNPVLQTSPGTSPPGTYGLLNSIKSGWQSVSTQMNALRQTTPATTTSTATQPFDISTTLTGLKDSANAARVASSRAVARGLASGYSAARTGVGDLWHADENKIRNSGAVESTSLQWIQTADSMCLGLAYGGKLAVYSIVKAARMRGKTEFIGLKVEKGSKLEYVLPHGGQVAANEVCLHQGPHGFWSLRNLTSGATPHHPKRSTPHEIIQDDVITNPLFCPFHVDPKVSMMVYSDDGEAQQRAQSQSADANSAGKTFWCFGEAVLPSIKVNHDSTGIAALVTYDGTVDAMIESRVTVHPVSQEIAIQSHRVHDAERQQMEDDNWGSNAFDD